MVSSISADEVIQRLDPAEAQAIQAFRHSVRLTFGPRVRDLRLFGSKVRGDDHEESDIDLLVLVDVRDPDLERGMHEIAASLSWKLRPHVWEFDRYHAPISRASGFYEEMRRESVRL